MFIVFKKFNIFFINQIKILYYIQINDLIKIIPIKRAQKYLTNSTVTVKLIGIKVLSNKKYVQKDKKFYIARFPSNSKYE